MPTGTIGCEVLNIPDSTIEKLDAPCNVLNQLLQGMNLSLIHIWWYVSGNAIAQRIKVTLGITG